jgi:hypothetical protein
MKKAFAIVNPWPGVPTGEMEAVKRIKKASKNLGIKCYVISSEGYIVKEVTKKNKKGELIKPKKNQINEKITNERISREDVDFVISSHFITTKIWDIFTYGLLWNPPIFLSLWPEYTRYIDNYLMYDDLIGNASKGIMQHAKDVFGLRGQSVNENIFLYPSVSETSILKPNLEGKLKLFYCGMQWEKSASMPKRHDEVFRGLDKTGYLSAFGPEEVNGIRPWDGYKSYKGSLPFDGESIIKQINKCGVALAISSSEHNRNSAMSNRLYESIAGGAVVITDSNDFVNKYFGDTVLKITADYGDQDEVLEQIKSHFNWVKNNREKAKQMVIKAQEILKEKFSYEVNIRKLFEVHQENFKRIQNKKELLNNSNKIDVLVRWDKQSISGFDEVINNINCQNHRNINLIIIIDKSLQIKIENLLISNLKNDVKYQLVALDIFNSKVSEKSGFYRKLSTGEMLIIAKQYIKSDYLAFLSSSDIWFSSHLSSLLKVCNDNPNINLAYSGLFSEIYQPDGNKDYYVDFFHKMNPMELLNFHGRDSESKILIRSNIIKQIPETYLTYSDYFEYNLIMIRQLIDKKAEFSNQLTYGKRYYVDFEKNPNLNLVINKESQCKIIQDLFKNELGDYEIKAINDTLNNIKKVEEKISHSALTNFVRKDDFKNTLVTTIKSNILKRRPLSKAILKLVFGKENWSKRRNKKFKY